MQRHSRMTPPFRLPMAGPYFINNALGSSHAYDKGHSDKVRWIEKQRHGVLAEADPRGFFYPEYAPQKLIELDSAGSVPIQAADIAAAIARELWHRNNLAHVVRHFEYVTYNGERLSEDKAAHCQRILDEEAEASRGMIKPTVRTIRTKIHLMSQSSIKDFLIFIVLSGIRVEVRHLVESSQLFLT